jgi:hypothetical protein
LLGDAPAHFSQPPSGHDLGEALFGLAAALERVLEGGDRLGQRRDVFLQRRQHVARDVECPVLGLDLVERDDPHRVLHVLEVAIPAEDLRGVLGLEIVLRPAPPEQARGVGDQHLAPARGRLLLAQHQDARGQTGAVEQVGRQADDRFDEVELEQLLADAALGAFAEQRALRQHDGHAAGAVGHGLDHVLHPGEVAARLEGGRPAKLRPKGSLSHRSSPHFSSENGGLAMTQSKADRRSPSKKAGLRSVSPRTILKSSMPCRKRFIRAMDEVVRFFSWP